MKHRLTNLQRLGISQVLVNLRETTGEMSINKGGLLKFKHLIKSELYNAYYMCYNDKRYIFTLYEDENINPEYEYVVKYDSHENIFHVINIEDIIDERC